jgi:hypothetical protein
MSRVYFHSPSNEAAELRGSERHHASFVVNQIALGLLNVDGHGREEQLRAWLPQNHYLRRTQPGLFVRSYETAFFVGGDESLIIKDGEPVNVWELALNTAMAIGNDTVRFFARLHAQCEVHGYVEGYNREWLAAIIDEGRKTGLYRVNQGWESVTAALRVCDTEPMVMSYSVCDGFPNPYVGDWMPELPEGQTWSSLPLEQQREQEVRQEAWYDLPREEQWERSLRALRGKPNRGLELTPDHWSDFRFGHNMAVWDLFDTERQEVKI